MSYSHPKAKKLTEYTTIWKDGSVKEISFRDEQFRIQGVKKCWSPCGILVERTNYLNGLRHGLREEWFKNGEPKIYINYKHGDLFGIYKIWYDNGHLGMELGTHKIVLEGKAEVDFMEDPELFPTSPKEKMLFNLKYGKFF
jgi:antitoxin component YwqK of YwqJK toxin-antitoxin module